MNENLEQQAVKVEKTPETKEKIDLSRRTFLSCLAILGVGGAAAMTLGVTEADAASESDAADAAETPAEGEKVEFVQVRRRVARRRVRRTARRVRRRTGVRRRSCTVGGCAGRPAG